MKSLDSLYFAFRCTRLHTMHKQILPSFLTAIDLSIKKLFGFSLPSPLSNSKESLDATMGFKEEKE